MPPQRPGYETEVNLSALKWIDHLADKLERGYLLTVDYGFPREEYYAAHRATGTLQTRAEHRLLASPFDNIGGSDITAHVEWTSLVERGEADGLRLTGFTDQYHFLAGIISGGPELDFAEQARRALQTLLHPEMLGRSFKMLGLAKNVDPAVALSAFKFARDPRAALGI